MIRVLLDTQTWVWSLTQSPRLSPRAAVVIMSADEVCISAVSVFDVAAKIRAGRWAGMTLLADRLPDILAEQNGVALAVTPDIALRASHMDGTYADPFERMIAATALEHDLKIVSPSSIYDGIDGGTLERIW